MTTKRNDDDGWKRGAKGIDGNDSSDITRKWMETEATACMYLLTDAVVDYEGELVDTDYLAEGASGSELLQSARRGNKPLLGKGEPTSPEQTGFRKRKLSGAF
jgi:hypothetical protein